MTTHAVILGGAGEPYCGPECSQKGGNAIFEVSMGSQKGRPGKCVTCGASVRTGDDLSIPLRAGVIGVFCSNCVRGDKLKSYTAGMRECAWCGNPVDRTASFSEPTGLFSCTPDGKVSVNHERLKDHLRQMKQVKGLQESPAVFVSSEGDIEKAVTFPYLSDFLTMTVDRNYLMWKRSTGPVYLFRTKDDKWVETFARCSWDTGRPVDPTGFQAAIDALVEELLPDEERLRRRDEKSRQRNAEIFAAQKAREDEKKRRRAEKARQEEESKRLAIQRKRKSQGECILCGERLGLIDRLFKKERHGRCKTFVA